MTLDEAFEVVCYGLLEGGAPPDVKGVTREFEDGARYFARNSEPQLAQLFKRLMCDQGAIQIAVRYLQSTTRTRNYIFTTAESASSERELMGRLRTLIAVDSDAVEPLSVR